MKNIIFLLCAIFTFSMATAQTDTKKKDQNSTEKTRVQNNTGTTTSPTLDNMGVVNPNDSPEHGATGRDNSRQAELTSQRHDTTVTRANTTTTTTSSGTTTTSSGTSTNKNTNTTRPTGQ
jgi:hypothetical protein